MSFFELFWTFFYIGLFTIGGGQVAITLMYEPFVNGGVISAEEFYNMVAVSESTPGPIGINMATYIGCSQHGILGGIVVTFANVLPSLIIIILIAKFFNRYHDTKIVQNTFACIRPVSVALIAIAAFEVVKISVVKDFSVLSFCIFLIAFGLQFIKKVSPIVVILFGAICGIIFF